MGPQQAEPFVFKSKTFTEVELGLIREIVDSYSHLGRYELAQTIAAVLKWERANGSPKWRECRDLLEKLADDGLVTLPELRNGRPRGSETKVPISADGDPGQELIGSVRDVAPVQLSLVRKESDRLLWRELVGRYHYLGHKVPFGAQLRYLIRVSEPREAVRKLIGYIDHNRDRVTYSEFEDRGIPKGSGGIESANKYIHHVRLKRIIKGALFIIREVRKPGTLYILGMIRRSPNGPYH